MRDARQTLGRIGEEAARRHLAARGYKILLRNYECALGEIDLIARHSDTLVFIEVKTKSSLEMGCPAEEVTWRKRRQIVKAASFYLKRYGLKDVACRFDVISVFLPEGGKPMVEIIPDAFREGE